MARRVLIIERSATMRQALASVIMAQHHDIRIIEAEDCAAAAALLADATHPCHLLVFHWDLVDETWREAQAVASQHRLPLLVVGPELQSAAFQVLQEGGLDPGQIVPCRCELVAEAVDRLCDPLGLRREQRYVIPGTIARLHQGRTTYFGVVIDISRSGMLCDIEYVPAFCWHEELLVSIDFPDPSERAEGIRGRVRRLAVIEVDEKGQPLIVRLAIHFIEVPSSAADICNRAFAAAAVSPPLAAA